MELRDLNEDERVALVGLMKLVVLSDGEVSEDELEHVEVLANAFGEGGYQAALDRFERQFRDLAAFRGFLQQIRRQDARDLIFGTILESADEGGLDTSETSLLDWLSRTWNVKIEIEDEPAEPAPGATS
ncbi:MAG TPA: hypothetical protein VMT03_10740 [Polyangia bacterium]|nr:hypothetical protein [Polyangia bacterium]